MSKNDSQIRDAIEKILVSSSYGCELIEYLDQVPSNQCRRVLYILSEIYPCSLDVDDNDYVLIKYIFTQDRYLTTDTICNFLRSINTLDLKSKDQKHILTTIIRDNINILSNLCSFELSEFMSKNMAVDELISYMEASLSDKSCHINIVRLFDLILRYDKRFKNDMSLKLKQLRKNIINQLEYSYSS